MSGEKHVISFQRYKSASVAALVKIISIVCALLLAYPACCQDEPPGRTLLFPPQRAVGIVKSRPLAPQNPDRSWYEDWETIGPATGKLSIPAGHQVRLDVSREAVSDTRFLSRLDPNALDALSLRSTDLPESSLLHVGSQRSLKYLDLSSNRINGNTIHFKTLSSLSELEWLDLSAFGVERDGFGVGDEAMRVVSAMPKLKTIRLRLTKVTDAGFADLCNCSTLAEISIAGTAITDKGLVHLEKLPHLRSLTLGVYDEGAKVTDRGLITVGKLKNLTYLSLAGTDITDQGLKRLAKLKRLEQLGLDNTKVTENGLAELKPLRALKRLRFYERVTDVGAAHLAKLASLVNVSSNLNVTDQGVAELAKLPKLEQLSLSEQVTDAATEHLAKMPALKNLWFQRCAITDQGLAKLTSLKQLEFLLLHDAEVTSEGLRHLKSFPKLWWLSLEFSTEPDAATPAAKISLRQLAEVHTLKDLSLGGSMGWRQGVPVRQLEHVAALRNLENLELNNDMIVDNQAALQLAALSRLARLRIEASTIDDKAIVFLHKLPELKTLTISCQITDDGLQEFRRLEQLTYLQIASPFVTDEGIRRLQRQMPSLQTVNHYDYRLGGSYASSAQNDNYLRKGKPSARSRLDMLEGKAAPLLVVDQWLNAEPAGVDWAGLRGKVVLVHFFSQRLSSNSHTLPLLKRLDDTYREQGLVILSLHRAQGAEGLKEFAQARRMTWPVGVDRDDVTKALFSPGEDYPGLFLIDHTGQVRMAGILELETERALQDLLAKARLQP